MNIIEKEEWHKLKSDLRGIETGMNDVKRFQKQQLKSDLRVIEIKSLTNDVSRQLLTEGHMAAMPGSTFEPNSIGFIRISCATSQERIQVALGSNEQALRRIIGMSKL